MRYWFDSEFHDDGTTLALISIGVVDANQATTRTRRSFTDFDTGSPAC